MKKLYKPLIDNFSLYLWYILFEGIVDTLPKNNYYLLKDVFTKKDEKQYNIQYP